MSHSTINGLHIIVLGGDVREIIIAHEFAKCGAHVYLDGFDLYQGTICQQINRGLPKAVDVVILPLPGILPNHSIYAPFSADKIDLFAIEHLLHTKIQLLCGKMPKLTQQYLHELGVKVLLTAGLAEVALYNAIPTAEGAVEAAIHASSTTIFGSSILITGFGACARYLARILAALGAKITIVARKRAALMEAATFGYTAINFSQLAASALDFDYIFNTVPSLVLTAPVLAQLHKDVIIIDLASAPGGTDFNTAKQLGINAMLLSGLPGKVAPVTAGKMLAEIYLALIN